MTIEVHIDADAPPLDPRALDAAMADVLLESVAGDQAGAKRPKKPRPNSAEGAKLPPKG